MQCDCYAAKCIRELRLYNARHIHMGLIVVVFDVHYAILWTHFTYTQAHSHALAQSVHRALIRKQRTDASAIQQALFTPNGKTYLRLQSHSLFPRFWITFFCFPRLHRICACIAGWYVCKTREHVCSCSQSENKINRKTRLAREERFRMHAKMKRNSIKQNRVGSTIGLHV